jgi:hypothetical protein
MMCRIEEDKINWAVIDIGGKKIGLGFVDEVKPTIADEFRLGDFAGFYTDVVAVESGIRPHCLEEIKGTVAVVKSKLNDCHWNGGFDNSEQQQGLRLLQGANGFCIKIGVQMRSAHWRSFTREDRGQADESAGKGRGVKQFSNTPFDHK